MSLWKLLGYVLQSLMFKSYCCVVAGEDGDFINFMASGSVSIIHAIDSSIYMASIANDAGDIEIVNYTDDTNHADPNLLKYDQR